MSFTGGQLKVSRVRPIHLVLPGIRSWLGLEIASVVRGGIGGSVSLLASRPGGLRE